MDENTLKITCIECPLGCEMTVEVSGGGTEGAGRGDTGKGREIRVSGNRCARGKKYAVQEVVDPRRVLTTTVFVEGGMRPLLPVMSSEAIPRGMVMDCIREISKIKVKAPVNYGDVIVKNVCGTGVDIVASRSMVRK